ncbi:helix-turn-helix domain-containing protein [Jannaschia helgolandensis]|uniref:Transcriptional regulator, XRE family n=1 Tax=Jannaschia helgolandensis TaxID=188906 RepID=A0A1H7S3W5_9RHOB|nr:helix-turn-helix transcriptional regulator [Jannaschia helgolandensis]SEL66979.1 transcriptional regulator, XRE family [Jannaschia helgolandensis]
MAVKVSSLNARRALEALGANIKTARLKRRISVKGFAERVGVSESTVTRLEKGDDGVSIGTLAMACLVLGEIERISDFLDAGSDDTGLLLDRDALPKRIDKKRKPASPPSGKGQSTPLSDADDEEGVGF